MGLGLCFVRDHQWTPSHLGEIHRKVPPKATFPPINNALLRDYENPLVSLNKALLGPYFLGGGSFGGVP